MKDKRGKLVWDETGKWLIGLAVLILIIVFLIFVVAPLLGLNISRLFKIGP